MKSGQKIILAIYEDLEKAAQIWFDFAEGQKFKVSSKALKILEKIPSEVPEPIISSELSHELNISQRTIDDNLKNLYESGILSRRKLDFAGAPWGYWCETEVRKIVNAENLAEPREKLSAGLSAPSGTVPEPRKTTQEIFLRGYMAKESSDSLIDSISNTFTKYTVISKGNVEAIKYRGLPLVGECPEKIYLSYFSPKKVRGPSDKSNDNETPRKDDSARSCVVSADSDDQTCVVAANSCANAKVQFNTDYDSDWNGSIRHFKEGEITEIPEERAETWIKRGIVESTLN
jgi:DNA-binding Lrp family transcriptional regulator